MEAISVCLVTCPDQTNAEELAYTLVTSKLAACVNIIATVKSVYRWNEEVCVSNECLLVIKTASRLVRELEAKTKELHPYDVPEFIEIQSTTVSDKYGAWLLASVLPVS